MSDSMTVATSSDQQDLLVRLSALLSARTGLALTPNQWGDLQRAVTAVAAELELPDFRACAECLLTTPSSRPLQLLIDHLTIGETYFFRDPAVFAALREHLLPALIAARRDNERRLRIWCAGCSTGEEAYSIAIELSRALPDLASWNATVLATDINQHFLRKASNGIYDRWSFRDSVPKEREPYIFANAEGHFTIAPPIKALVRFTHLNLAGKSYPAPGNGTTDIDIIFCRNVLMYLQPERAQAVLLRLCDALRPDGWLIVSNVEASLVNLPTMLPVRLPDLMLFRKKSADTQPEKKTALQKNNSAANSNRDGPSRLNTARTTRNNQQQACAENFIEPRPLSNDEIDNPHRLLQLAKTNADQGHFDVALKYCEQALVVNKLNPAAHYLLASILLEGNTTQISDINAAAEASLKRALYLDSEWVMAHIALGNLLLSQPLRRAEAKRHFDNARALLNNIPMQQVIAESDGLTAGQLLEMINVMSIAEIAP